jgi:hypothetical protein
MKIAFGWGGPIWSRTDGFGCLESAGCWQTHEICGLAIRICFTRNLLGQEKGHNGFIDAKLRELASEKRQLHSRLQELESAPQKSIDPAAVLQHGMEAIRDLPRLLESGRIEERKEFVRAFIEGIVVQPDKLRLDLQIRKIPALEPGNSTCLMVAGARYEAVQMDLEGSSQLFVAKHLRFVA